MTQNNKISNGVKIIQERQKCIGCGSCAVVCENFFSISDRDGLADLKGAKQQHEFFELEVEDAGCAVEAADICPVQIIKIS
jgi:ferredoxin